MASIYSWCSHIWIITVNFRLVVVQSHFAKLFGWRMRLVDSYFSIVHFVGNQPETYSISTLLSIFVANAVLSIQKSIPLFHSSILFHHSIPIFYSNDSRYTKCITLKSNFHHTTGDQIVCIAKFYIMYAATTCHACIWEFFLAKHSWGVPCLTQLWIFSLHNI